MVRKDVSDRRSPSVFFNCLTWMLQMLEGGQRMICVEQANEMLVTTFNDGGNASVISNEDSEPKLSDRLVTGTVDNRRQVSWKEILDQSNRSGFQVDSTTFISLLRSCIEEKTLLEGKRIHDQIVHRGLERDIHLGRLLVQMYGKCGALEEALVSFSNTPEKNVFLWNFIIRTYARLGKGHEVLQIFNQMQQEGILPDKFTFVNIFSGCACKAGLVGGKKMHARIWSRDLELDVVVGTALVNMYGKTGRLEDARKIFAKIPRRDVVLWTTMISVYAQHQKAKEALELFEEMQLEGLKPNKVTFICILDVCARCTALYEGERMHHSIKSSGIEPDVVLGNALVNMYGKCGSLSEALGIFNTMPERNVVSWNTIISVHAQNQKNKEALQLFDQMQEEDVKPNYITFVCCLEACGGCAAINEGEQVHAWIIETGLESDLVAGTALVNFYGKCGRVKDAWRVFDKIPKRDIILWNAMIAVYAHHGQLVEAIQLYDKMQFERVKPTNATFVSMLDACASCAGLAEGERIHTHLLLNGIEQDVILQTALMNMYGKCGKVEAARKIFYSMPERNSISWNAMITIYTQCQQVKEAISLFCQMQHDGLKPNNLSFLSMLDGCAKYAALDEGRKIHTCIVDTGLELDIVGGNAIIDMYGKCGSLEDAWRAFDKMQEKNVVSWTAMIAVYAKHGQAIEALQLFHGMLQEGIKPNNVTYVHVLTAYNHAGLIDEACYCFASTMRDNGISPAIDHYMCMIDLIWRAGLLEKAEILINCMPFQPVAESFVALLGA